jgi:hypothetical protein
VSLFDFGKYSTFVLMQPFTISKDKPTLLRLSTRWGQGINR